MKTRPTLTALAVLALAGLAWAAAPLLAQPGPDGPPRGWETFAERHDVDGDGRVTEEELFQTFQMFDRLDADGDGFVTEADFDAHRSSMVLHSIARRADADRDGDLTAAELTDWFAWRDANDDGRLDADDFEGRRPGVHRPRGGLADALDADGDGVVTQADVTALFARFDADGDGVVSAEELPEVGPRHHRHHRHGRHGRR